MSSMPKLPVGFEFEEEEPTLPEGFEFEKQPQKKEFPWSARGKVHGAYKALKERPDLAAAVFPKAVEQLGQSAESMQNPINSLLKSLLAPGDESFKGQRQTPGKIVSERFSGGIPEHLKQGAQDIADIQEFIMGLAPIPGLEMPSLKGALPGRRLPTTLEGEVVGQAPRGLKALFGEPAKMESGLTQYKFAEAKHPERGIISPERQQKLLGGLDNEAAQIAQASVEKHLPMSKQIQEGVDFTHNWEQDFGKIRKLAEKYNPEIDITPVSKLIQSTREKYSGVPRLHEEARNVMKEIAAFSRNPQTEMKNLLKIYRSNNQKQRRIYETAKLTGKQEEYSDFLSDMNRAIATSFENTLPADSPWMKEFRELNKQFSDFNRSLKTLQMLRPILHGEATPAQVSKLATDIKSQDKLILNMGKEGAQEIIQLAKDLKKLTKALKKIPAKEMSLYEKILPFSFFVPGMHLPTGIAGALKAKKYLQRLWGWWLTQPSKRKAIDRAVKAINDKNLIEYKKAADELMS